MFKGKALTFWLGLSLVTMAGNSHADLILNGGLENYTGTLTNDRQNFPTTVINNWVAVGSAGRYYVKNTAPCDGACSISTWGMGSYIYQENIAVAGNTEYSLSAYIRPFSDPWPVGVGTPLQIVWFPTGVAATMANYSQRISQTNVVTFVPTTENWNIWNYIEGKIIAPSNAAGCIVIVGDKTASGWTAAYFDDISMIASVPEPATLGLLSLGGVLALIRRKNN